MQQGTILELRDLRRVRPAFSAGELGEHAERHGDVVRARVAAALEEVVRRVITRNGDLAVAREVEVVEGHGHAAGGVAVPDVAREELLEARHEGRLAAALGRADPEEERLGLTLRLVPPGSANEFESTRIQIPFLDISN